MKKILAVLSALVVVTALATAPAKANNSEEVIIGVLGGALGGLIVGGGLAGPRYYAPPPVYYAPPPVYYAPPPVYYAPPPVYVQPQPVYVPPAASAPGPIYVERCFTKTVRRYDPVTNDYVRVKKKVCK